mmetsp:Transcript_34906/g.69298  ORF Transcript_34906/g.69298 Transcript_34906/m.69298 type:complete len:365 (-) Transcript_34906:11-1105(-)
MHKSRGPSWSTMASKLPEMSACCFETWSTSGLSMSFKDFVQQFGIDAVALITASRSCRLSPTEWIFFLFSGSTKAGAPQAHKIAASKANTFQSKGEVQVGLSKVVRADKILMFSMTGKSWGRNAAQLSSIQPRSAFVSRTTVPRCLANRKVSAAASATSARFSRCHSAASAQLSNLNPCRWSQDDGNTVSSQSNTKTVSSLAKAPVGTAPISAPQSQAPPSGASAVGGGCGALVEVAAAFKRTALGASPWDKPPSSSEGNSPGPSWGTTASSSSVARSDSASSSSAPLVSDSRSSKRVDSLHSDMVVVGVVSSPESSSSSHHLEASAKSREESHDSTMAPAEGIGTRLGEEGVGEPKGRRPAVA